MWWFGKKGPSGFSACNTAEEVTQGIDGTGLTAIITGASQGIGAETARVLALRGVHVVMGVRNTDTGSAVKEAILKETCTSKVDVMKLDLSSMESVRKFASKFNSLGLPLNILINNAGNTTVPFKRSHDNIEMTFAINHIGHFLLTDLLLENMKSTARKTDSEGRIINVSSEAHRLAHGNEFRLDKINNKSGYNNFRAYGQSKLANILHANELARRLKKDRVQITANSLHPGAIVTTLWQHTGLFSGWFAAVFSSTIGKYALKNVQQGASTTCYLALHPNVKGVSGEYFKDNNVCAPSSEAHDEELAKELWELSMNLIH